MGIRTILVASLCFAFPTGAAAAQADADERLGIGASYLEAIRTGDVAAAQLAVGPELLAEYLLPVFDAVVRSINVVRWRVLNADKLPDSAVVDAVRREFDVGEPWQRREMMRTLDPATFASVWPRGGDSEVLEVELFLRRRCRLALPAGIEALAPMGEVLFGRGSRRHLGCSPCGESPAELRAYALTGLGGADGTGALSCLVEAAGDGVDGDHRADPAVQPLLWLDLVRRFRAEKPRAWDQRLAMAQEWGLPDVPLYLVGRERRWQAVLDTCDLLDRAIGASDASGRAVVTIYKRQGFDHAIPVVRRAAQTALAHLRADRTRTQPRVLAEGALDFYRILQRGPSLSSILDADGRPVARVVRRIVKIGAGRCLHLDLAPVVAAAEQPK